MPKFLVRVSHRYSSDIPVEAKDVRQAVNLITELIKKDDIGFSAGLPDYEGWEHNITFVLGISDREFEEASKECEVVNPDGTHGWRQK